MESLLLQTEEELKHKGEAIFLIGKVAFPVFGTECLSGTAKNHLTNLIRQIPRSLEMKKDFS